MNTVNKDMRDAEKNLAGLEKCCGLCSCPWQKVSFKNWIRIIFSNWGSELIIIKCLNDVRKMHYAMNYGSLWFLTLRRPGILIHGLLTLRHHKTYFQTKNWNEINSFLAISENNFRFKSQFNVKAPAESSPES